MALSGLLGDKDIAAQNIDLYWLSINIKTYLTSLIKPLCPVQVLLSQLLSTEGKIANCNVAAGSIQKKNAPPEKQQKSNSPEIRGSQPAEIPILSRLAACSETFTPSVSSELPTGFLMDSFCAKVKSDTYLAFS
jgi:hypothetical protein